MRTATTFALVLTLALFAGCKNDEQTATGQTTAQAPLAGATALTPEQLGELGARMRSDPQRADELLTQRGLTRESFEKQIRDVTESPEASKRYAEAYRKSSA